MYSLGINRGGVIPNSDIFKVILIADLREKTMPNSIVPNLGNEDEACQKRIKSRNPKPREKWSRLWQIPSTVLNSKTSSGGKRMGFERFNELSCKKCDLTYHSKTALDIHRHDIHGSSSSFPSPSPSSKPRSSPKQRVVHSEPLRRSSRRHNQSINYNEDDIQIIKNDLKKKELLNTSISSEIEVLSIDDEDDDIQELDVTVNNSSMVDEDDDIQELDGRNENLVSVDDDVEVLEIEHIGKRKPSSDSCSVSKRQKQDTNEDLIEVKSSSGKSLMVKRSMLNKVMKFSPKQPSRKRVFGK